MKDFFIIIKKETILIPKKEEVKEKGREQASVPKYFDRTMLNFFILFVDARTE